ncbi:MAG: SCP2 sterol-binding domain-containing protein [Defluviitaleaceae bacterium]|nr:SCP2 sterol-binding domain-containing protein [Defluviitaleaceae bacterium]MCL2836215.1 SCP2 sterol-binding domain-containing protein [Defluviitaleaceae bacterium]
MKIAVINASAAGSAADAMMRIVTETLAELGEEIVHIKLDRIKIPFHGSSEKAPEPVITAVHDAIYEIMGSAGAVFVAPAALGGVAAQMQAFLEHFSQPQFSHALLDKNCMVVVSGEGRYAGTREALESMSRIIGHLGGSDSVRIWLPGGALETDADARLFVEKQTEDYYRILRQGRKFYPLETHTVDIAAQNEEDTPDVTVEIGDESLYNKIKERAQNQILTDEQEQDISDITQFVAQRLENPVKPEKPALPIKPRNKTSKQLTASMPHYFNPQLAAGIRTVIALNITGDENFGATVTIDGVQCRHDESASTDAEMQITVDSKIWTDILTGKLSAQKAFMIGQLKVRGNFLLLTKMDQLFTKMEL